MHSGSLQASLRCEGFSIYAALCFEYVVDWIEPFGEDYDRVCDFPSRGSDVRFLLVMAVLFFS
jgi:hypothetical protein